MLLTRSVQLLLLVYKITLSQNDFVTPDYKSKNIDAASHDVTPKRKGGPKKSVSELQEKRKSS